MKIALIGFGQMGQMIEKSALARGHSISAKITSNSKDKISSTCLHDTDVCIDFSRPDVVLDNIRSIAKLKKNIVVGTTGWHDHLDEAEKIVRENHIGLMYSSNFSVGVNLFLQVVSAAAALINSYPGYDVGMIESHHNKKIDSPSGTAQAIAAKLLKNILRKQHVVHHAHDGPVAADAIHVSSLRCGAIPGTHSVVFDSNADTITLTHEARNREGFALGAVLAAEWIAGKKGIHTAEEMFN